MFHGILNNSIQAGDSRIDKDGTIHTRLVKGWESIIKQCVIPRWEFTVRIYIILITSDKGQINIDNQRGVIIVRLSKSRVDRSNTYVA
jgi:hypothetical protein